jgi:hypothetical protein
LSKLCEILIYGFDERMDFYGCGRFGILNGKLGVKRKIEK